MLDKCKSRIEGVSSDVLIVLILVLASIISFGLGFMAGREPNGINTISITESSIASTTSEQVVASRNGTKFYYPWCSGVERISDTNKVWFADALTAIKSGYSIATNCTGP